MGLLIVYILIAIYISWIWIDYYRLIDLYEKENLKHFILMFLLGGCSTLLVFGLHAIFWDQIAWELGNGIINDFGYSVVVIGLTEELAKIIPFLLFLLFFKKVINEPIDYFAYICCSALGFAAAENVIYFNRNGAGIIEARSILSTVGHMFNTSLVAYGIIRFHFIKHAGRYLELILYSSLAAVSHGFYDFWLLHENTRSFGWIITILYFLITISVFAAILNNALSNSTFFKPKHFISSTKVAYVLLRYYAVVFIIQFLLFISLHGIYQAVFNFIGQLMTTGFIIVVTCVRMSRFRLTQGVWQRIRLEFPIYIATSDAFNIGFSGLTIRGESTNESSMNAIIENYCDLHPVSTRSQFLIEARKAFIEKKIVHDENDVYYLVKIFIDEIDGKFEMCVVKPKGRGETRVAEKYPIVAVLQIHNMDSFLENKMIREALTFQEWAYLKW